MCTFLYGALFGWLVLICCERKVLLAGWWLVLIWCEKKTLLLVANRTERHYSDVYRAIGRKPKLKTQLS